MRTSSSRSGRAVAGAAPKDLSGRNNQPLQESPNPHETGSLLFILVKRLPGAAQTTLVNPNLCSLQLVQPLIEGNYEKDHFNIHAGSGSCACLLANPLRGSNGR